MITSVLLRRSWETWREESVVPTMMMTLPPLTYFYEAGTVPIAASSPKAMPRSPPCMHSSATNAITLV